MSYVEHFHIALIITASTLLLKRGDTAKIVENFATRF